MVPVATDLTAPMDLALMDLDPMDLDLMDPGAPGLDLNIGDAG